MERPLTQRIRPQADPMNLAEYEDTGGYEAARKAVQALGALRRLQSMAAKAPASPCTHCRDNFPLPEAADVFDSMVIAGYVERRTACGMCSANEKPCLDMGAQQGGGV